MALRQLNKMKKILILIIFIGAIYGIYQEINTFPTTSGTSTNSNDVLDLAYKNKENDLQVTGSGIVIKLLPDDNDGSRHQRFILRASGTQTVLIAHNIDLAPRINLLKKGDYVEFNGEYEWNSKGGIIHWTHHDPNGRHITGWIKHNGKVYK